MSLLGAGEIVNKAARFAAAIVLARALSLEEFGVLNVGIAIAGLLFVACGLGLPEVSSRDASVAPQRSQELVERVLTGRLLVLAVLSAVLLAIAATFAAQDLPAVAVAISMAVALALSAEWLLRGLESMGSIAIANSAGGAVVMAGAVLIVLTKPTAEAALAIFAAGELTVALLTLRAAPLVRIPRLRVAGLRTVARGSWPLGASALVVYSYYANLDTIVLSVTRSAEEAGLYSAPYRLFLAFTVVGTFAAYALLPRITRAVAAGPAQDAIGMDGLRRALMPLAGYGLIVLGAIELGGDQLVTLLFGADFSGQGAVLLTLCLALAWYVMSFPVGYALIARGANRRFLAGAVTAGGLNVVLNLALIPPFGTIGAASATTIALVAGSIVWLGAHGMLGRATAPALALVVGGTVTGLVALLSGGTSANIIGLGTIGIGTIVTASALDVRRFATRSG